MPDQRYRFVTPITPEQVWAARGLLRWSRERLSGESDVPYGFIVKFEQLGHIAPLFSRERGFDGLSAIRQAFERHGVTFSGQKSAVTTSRLNSAAYPELSYATHISGV